MNVEKENSCRKRSPHDCDASCTPTATVVLRAVKGVHKNRIFELRVRQGTHKSQKSWLIGRKPVPISFPKDNEVSSKHGELTFFFDSQQLHITDLGSTNGTKINGKFIPVKSSRLLLVGDTFSVGASQVVFEEVRQPVHPVAKQSSPNKKHKLIHASPIPTYLIIVVDGHILGCICRYVHFPPICTCSVDSSWVAKSLVLQK